jgi:diaminohydroxyphosphoribosylaminopyrimidine deaminase/5-amino-6-(5-phosphoribosylamino)uracil reductase
VKLIAAPAGPGGVDLDAALMLLGKEGITRVLVEAGHRVTTAFFAHKRVDCIYWFRGPLLIGADGKGGVGELSVATLADMHRFERVASHTLGEDILEVYRPCLPA